MKRFLPTIIMVVILAALGYYVFYGELKGGAKLSETPVNPYDKPIMSYTADQMTKIKLASKDHSVSFENSKQAGKWVMVEKPELITNSAQIKLMAGMLGNLTTTRTLTTTAELGQFGLKPPLLTVTMTLTNGNDILIRAGDPVPNSSAYYTLINNDTSHIYLANYDAINGLLQFFQSATVPAAAQPASTTVPLKPAGP